MTGEICSSHLTLRAAVSAALLSDMLARERGLERRAKHLLRHPPVARSDTQIGQFSHFRFWDLGTGAIHFKVLHTTHVRDPGRFGSRIAHIRPPGPHFAVPEKATTP